MSYSQVSDIQKDFPSVKFTDNPNAKVKLSDIPDFIDDIDALIDTYLAGRYGIPVTAPASANVLRMYSRTLVADKIKGLLEIDQQGSQQANQNVRTGLNTKDVLAILKDIRDGKADLPGASSNVSKPITAAFAAGGSPSTRFEKDTDQW